MPFSEHAKVWMNGTLVPWADARIHVASHVVHYGSAVFEGIRCYSTPKGSACFRLDAHMRRLYDSAKIYRMEYGLDCETLTGAGLETIRENGVDVKVSSWNRPAPNTFPSLAKSGANYANSQLIKMEAIVDGYTEAIA